MAKRVKTGGRQKGTPNKTTSEMKESISKLIASYQDSGRMSEDLMAIEDPRERLTTACKLMEFVMPKMRSVDTDLHVQADNVLSIRDRLKDLSTPPTSKQKT